jgi:chemotaxis protein histidine kinase CheA
MLPPPGPPRPPALHPGAPRLRTAAPRARPTLLDLSSVPASAPAAPEPAPPAPGPEATDYTAAFLEEAAGELQALAALLERVDWSAAAAHVRRRFHTIRGAAATLEFPEAARLATEGETLAAAAESGKAPATQETAAALRAAASGIAASLELEIHFPAPAEPGTGEPRYQSSEPLPAEPAPGEPPAPPKSAAQPPKLATLLEAWAADTPGAAAVFLAALATCRLQLESGGQPALAKSFAALEELVQDWGERPPPPAMRAVLRRCLEDAAAHQDAAATRPGLPWRRRWHLIFRSLRIALASEWSQSPQEQGGPEAPPETQNPKPVTESPDLDPEMVAAFLEEAQTLLEPMEAATLAWERGEDVPSRRGELRRHFHTLKGAANSVGLRALGASMHHAEDLLQSGDSGPGTPAWLMARLDELRAHLESLTTDPATPWPHDWSPASASPQQPETQNTKSGTSPETPTLRIPADRLRAVMDTAGELLAGQVQAAALDEDLAQHRAALDELRAHVIAWAEEERAGRPPGPEAWQAVEQAVAAAAAAATAQRQRAAAAQAVQLQRARRIQAELADFNMAPVSGLFRRLQRVFRDALQAERKEAELVLEGGRTRLDREIIERLYSPLLHLLRNAVAHGIEPPAERPACGKPASGRVRLAATAQPGAVVFEVEDDGAGIRTEAVRTRAIARRLLPADTAAISDEDAVRLLFTPGFSTKEAANDVAGRGVGLDVVKAEVEGMGGTVTVRSTPGRGALWSIRVPLNLSTAEALIVRAGALHAALPLGCVVRCLRLGPESLREENGRILCAEAALPYYALHELLGSSAGEDPVHGIVVDGGVFRAVLGVHHLGARREVVRKDPGPLLARLPHLAGVVPEADGSLLPLIQIPELLRRLSAAEAAVPSPLAAPLRVLVADDSPSVRRAHQKLLEKIGCRAQTVPDGAAALIRLKEERFDLLLTDLEMPGMDGLDLVRALRRDPEHSGLRAIVVTSRRETSLIRALADAGASWLPKPLDAPTLRAALAGQ